MDDAEEEKVRLLESIRLQDAALSAATVNSLTTIDSDSEEEELQSTVNSNVEQDRSGDIIFNEDISSRISDEPSWAEALEANQEYDAVLAHVEAEIKLQINKVDHQVKELRSKIETLHSHGQSTKSRGHWMYPYGMPYFKTASNYPCPKNEDYHAKKRNKEICWPDLPVFTQWVAEDKKALQSAVRTLSLQRCEEKAHFQLAVLQKDLAKVEKEGNAELMANIQQSIDAFDVDDVAQSMLEDAIANDEHDWMLISSKYMDGKQSPTMCRSFWQLYMHPKINKTPYSEEEEKNLLALVNKYNYQDWDRIAEELGTGRSGYQCFIVHQNKLNVALKKNTWDPDEDLKLLKLVEKYRIGDYVPWGKITYYLEGRTKTQVFNRWTYSLNPAIRKGRFTQDEDIMILVGVNMWGEDFQRISGFVKDRTTSQIRHRYKDYLSRSSRSIPWVVEDDEMLLKLVEQHGKNWKKIAEHFPAKDRTQVRHRFGTIHKWREKNPGAPLSEAPSRVLVSAEYKELRDQWERAKAILNCESVDAMVKAKNSIVSSLVKQNKKKTSALPKRKKSSLLENELVDYFRCSYRVPGGHKKVRLFQGEGEKYANELALMLPILKAELNLPRKEEVWTNTSMSITDRQILAKFLEIKSDSSEEADVEYPPELETLEKSALQHAREENTSESSTLFCDIKPSHLTSPTTANIDYIPTHNVASLYVDLPLIDMDDMSIVTDRNQDPSFFESRPVGEFSIVDEVIPASSSSSTEVLVCPPNFTNLVGLRTYLLNRRNLIDWCNEGPNEVWEEPSEKFKEAKKKFDERLYSLFLWPALMSRYGPTNHQIFLDEEVKNAELDQRVPFFTRDDMNVVKCTNVESEPSNQQSGDGDVGEKKQTEKRGGMKKKKNCASGPPKKRQKESLEESDPDDPEPI